MKFLSANASNNNVLKFNKAVENGDTVFVMFHSPHCGHCVATFPIWEQIESQLGDRYKHNDKVMIADIQDDVIGKTSYADQIEGFPTMWCISKNGAKIEPIEQAKLMNPTRTIDGFVEWIELKTPSSYSSPMDNNNNNNSSSHKGEKNVKSEKKKKYRVTPYPHKRSRRRHSAKNGGRKGSKSTRRKSR
jgi:thiol-disulfide isomerase/thioredoxin